MSEVVLYKVQEGVALLTVNNPPVNALNMAVRTALIAAVDLAVDDPAVGALVIQAQGRTFPSGADLRDFDKPSEEPTLATLCERVEACPKPVIAAIHGTALGAGFELALACHFRLVHVGAKLGFPDVALGLVPAAGGSQRLARVVGARAALDLLISGRPITAENAARVGLADKVVQKNLGRAAFGSARNLIASGAAPRRSRDRREGFSDPSRYLDEINERRADLDEDPRAAVHRAIDLVEAALLLPFEAGLNMEQSHYRDLVNSDQARGLRHAFLAERRTARVPQVAAHSPRPVSNVGVIGGGRLGSGIVRACLAAGLRVTLLEKDAPSLEAARTRVTEGLDRDVEQGRLAGAVRDSRLNALTAAADPEAIGEADLVIEAVVEDADARREVFAMAGSVTKPGTVLASAGLAPDFDDLAAASGRRDDVMGLRFFLPAHRVKLVEVVSVPSAAPDLAATGVAFARALEKLPVVPGDTGDSIALPLLSAMLEAATEMLLEGAAPLDVDAALRGEGFALGPLQLADLAGLDRLAALELSRPASALIAAMVAAGLTGQSSGRGFYRYGQGSKPVTVTPEVATILDGLRAQRGGTSRIVPKAEIAERVLMAMVSAGARLLVSGVAFRPSDIDAAAIAGIGFPRWHGGPMEMADHLGLLKVRNRLRELAEAGSADLYAPAPLFDVLIKNGASFDRLNRQSTQGPAR